MLNPHQPKYCKRWKTTRTIYLVLVGELILDQKVSKLQTNLKYNFAYMNFQNLELRAYLVAQLVKNRPAMQEIWVQFLGWEDRLEKGNSMECIVHRVAKSCTRLSDFHFHFSKLRKLSHMSIREINICSKAIKKKKKKV